MSYVAIPLELLRAIQLNDHRIYHALVLTCKFFQRDVSTMKNMFRIQTHRNNQMRMELPNGKLHGLERDPALVTWSPLHSFDDSRPFSMQYFWFDMGMLVKSRTETYKIILKEPTPLSEPFAYFSVIWRKAEHRSKVTNYRREEDGYLFELTSHNLHKFLEEYWTL